MNTMTNHWPVYQKRWEFNGSAEEAVIFSGAYGGYEARVQYEFMLQRGLKPSHRFLDLGCGALRGTIRLVDYLNNGNFFGADISVGLLKEALMECERQKFKNTPVLQIMDSFDLRKWMVDPRPFDFILCNSLTVHIEPDDIPELLKGIWNVLAEDGKAYISVHPLLETDPDPYRWDGYRWWYKRSWMTKQAEKIKLNLIDIPGKVINRIPGQKHPVIPVVNTPMTEWIMEGTI